MKELLLIGTLGLLPKNLLSRAVGAVAHAPMPKSMGQAAIRTFARIYGINLDEAELPIEEYATPGDFFVRRLKPGLRPLAPDGVLCPADGHVLNMGTITDGTFLQAKGRNYTITSLLGDEEKASHFTGGSWITTYLSPSDYHRVHFPLSGKVTSARYIPGQLWPVNRAGVHHVDGLFCVNERMVTYMDTEMGEVAVIMVGATSVGHMTMSYDQNLESNRGHEASVHEYSDLQVNRGDELGVFHLGSTVIMLFASPNVELEPFEEGQALRMGERCAHLKTATEGDAHFGSF